MNVAKLSRHFIKGMYWATRFFVVGLSVLLLFVILAFIFLRVYGVPGPILREAMRHINAAGIPVAVEGVTLTLHGWRADQVRYYSTNPDDLEPLFLAQHVYFSIRNSRQKRAGSEGLSIDAKAVEIELYPSVEWGIDIPPESLSRYVDQIDVALGFLTNRIEIAHGQIDWLGSRFNIEGTILKRREGVEPVRTPRQLPGFPVEISRQSFLEFERRIKELSIPDGATVDIDFLINTADYRAGWVNLAVRADALTFRKAGFSKVDISGSYAYPFLRFDRIGLFKGKQSLQLSGEYNLDTGLAGGALYNSITSNDLLLALPDQILSLLTKAELRVDHLPRFSIDFGPAPPRELLNRMTGTFSVRGVSYQGLEIEALYGNVKRTNNRLEFTSLQGSVLGQEERAAEVGSAMHGGTAAGEVFWDGNTREFGVDADINFDPLLLVQPLAFVEIATNIIQRFAFTGRPPQAHVALGSNVDDWSTFYIDIRGMANDMVVQGVKFTSVNVVQTYRNAQLNLDPVASMQGTRYLKGYAHMDFRDSTVSFDAVTSLNPADLEDMIYPDLRLFGHHIKTEGDVRIEAGGTFDWHRMQETDFAASVEADQLTIPIAAMEHFKAEVVGDGSEIRVNKASFGLYGGHGEGRFTQHWSPPESELPYEIDLNISDADFQQCLSFLFGDRPVNVSGIMNANAHIAADFTTNFYTTANGEGFVRVDNGQLTDLPLFRGFSRLMRKVFPSFTVLSITNLRGNFAITEGVISSEDAYFEGDLISAKVHGRYVYPTGFDAYIKAQVFREGRISKMVRVLTDPLMRLLEMKLEGPLSDPSWELEKF